MNARISVPIPVNEPLHGYAPGSPERRLLKEKLKELKGLNADIPLFIGGKELRTGRLADCRTPHDHAHRLGRWHAAGPKEVDLAVKAALRARKEWAAVPFSARAAVFLKAADLLAGPWRATLNAATMLGQSKNAYQAEIDAAAELVDFLRFNCHYAERLYAEQPASPRGQWNYMEFRPLEGFVFAVTPFNFTSIAGNLPTAPALMGNVVVWKPGPSAMFSAYFLMQLFKAAGLPDGVINLVSGQGAEVGDPVLAHPDFAGLHFTGSTATFQKLWKTIGNNIGAYKTYPRIVGEAGGKDFVVVHSSADVRAVVTGLLRGAFEYQGQKCSAASRAYIPASLWPKIQKSLGEDLLRVRMGQVEDFSNFMNAVIDRPAYDKISGAIDSARATPDARILFGGGCDDSVGYFIEPTVIEAKVPYFKTMQDEIFGPVLTVYVYPDDAFEETLTLCDRTSPYALTGAIFATDRQAVETALEALRGAAGNFYINDKPTGAVVGQQPFGGARASGTNDKAGSFLNLLRWTSPRAVKENFEPPADFPYPFMAQA